MILMTFLFFRNPGSNMEKRDDDPEDIEDLQFSVKGIQQPRQAKSYFKFQGPKQWIRHGSYCEGHEQPLFNRHRFENTEQECLFRRYILRVQHASITSAVALFVVLTAAMATASFIKVQAPTLSNLYHSLHCGVFVILFIVLCTRSIEDLYLNYVCYTIIFFCTAFCVVALPGEENQTLINTNTCLETWVVILVLGGAGTS